jgi:putative PIG3 family NAD(P)H quinone oxidoreductase
MRDSAAVWQETDADDAGTSTRAACDEAMKAVVFTGVGGNEVVEAQERPDPAPGPGQVLVAAAFAGVNPADALQRAGRYPAPPGVPPDIPGLEVAGTVVALGEGVSRWQPGDRVFGLVAGGGLADRVAVHGTNVAAIPERLSDRDAAAVPEAFITAHDAVVSQCSLSRGETLLVHGAAGGVGSAACQIGVELGARVIAVVRSDAAAESVAELHAESVRDESFAAEVAEKTDGKGADVILELVGAPHFPANLDVLASRGRIVVVGAGAGQDAAIPLLALMQKRASIRGTVLRWRAVEEKAQAVAAFERDVVPGLAAGRIRAVVDSEFPLEDAAAAFDRLEGRGKTGKVLIRFG